MRPEAQKCLKFMQLDRAAPGRRPGLPPPETDRVLMRRHVPAEAEQPPARIGAGAVRGDVLGEDLHQAVGEVHHAWREGHGEPVHIEVGEPVIHTPAARSVTGRAIFNRARRFRDLLAARRQLERAERAAWQSRNDYGVVEGVTVRRREDRDDVVFARHQYEQACREIGQRPVSYR
jgi:hypothetical protein